MSRELPILMSGPQVRAILDERMSQTRRVVSTRLNDERPAKIVQSTAKVEWLARYGTIPISGERWLRCPYGQPGDLLYVRETWAAIVPGGNFDEITGPPSGFPAMWQKPYVCRYRADPDPLADADREIRGFDWRPSIHMPKWASRLWLRVTDVRVERVQETTREDAVAEGVSDAQLYTAHATALWEEFRRLWDSLNAKRGHPWSANDWVWVVSFEPIGDAR